MTGLPADGGIRIAPSLLSADFATLSDELADVEKGGADLIHLDVMDGHFVPNITFGPPLVRSIRRCTPLFFDVHLMIEDPIAYAEPFAKAGAQGLTFQIEAAEDPAAVVREFRRVGVRVGVTLNPKTPIETIYPCLADVDMVLIMSVVPGFGGQAFMPEVLAKVRALREDKGFDKDVEIDGGINAKTIVPAAAAGVNVFVAGTAVFGEADRARAIDELRRAAESSYVRVAGGR